MAQAPRHTLDQLVVLQAIVETGSFAAAARRLHRVPSAVSYAVAGLEDALGVAVFDRSGHRAVLTEAGRRLLEASAEVLAAARRLEDLGASFQEGWEPGVQLVVDGALPMPPLLRALRRFTQRDLPTHVRLDVEYQAGVPEVFDRNEADLMLVLEFDATGLLEAEPLPPFEMVLLARPDHRLLGLPRPRREDLLGEVEIVVKDSSSRFAEEPRESWFGSAHVLYLSDFHAKRLALLEGLGFGWMPEHLIREELDAGQLVPIEVVEGHRWTYHPKLARRADRPLGPAGRLLRDLLVAELRGEVVQDC